MLTNSAHSKKYHIERCLLYYMRQPTHTLWTNQQTIEKSQRDWERERVHDELNERQLKLKRRKCMQCDAHCTQTRNRSEYREHANIDCMRQNTSTKLKAFHTEEARSFSYFLSNIFRQLVWEMRISSWNNRISHFVNIKCIFCVHTQITPLNKSRFTLLGILHVGFIVYGAWY